MNAASHTETTELTRTELGRRGEQQACDFLVARGHTILERNWRGGHCELDIISLDSSGVHFVEVKNRRQGTYLDGSVNLRKQKHLVSAARRYLSGRRQLEGLELFFDVVFIVEGESIDYYPQAFIPLYS